MLRGVILAAILLSGAASAAVPTIDQSLELVVVNAPKISPDGKSVIYEQSRTNWKANEFQTDLWLADMSTGQRHRLTAPVKSSTDAAWSPDGKWIAFLSDRPGQLPDGPADKKQIYLMSALGGEAQQLTHVEKGVNAFEWGKDSASVIFTAAAPDDKTAKDRKDYFGEYHVVHADYSMVQLWRQSLDPSADAEQLTDAKDSSVNSFSVSPDGAKVAFAAQRDPDLISGSTSKIYVLALADRKVEKLVDAPGPNDNPKWSPDGSQIAFQGAGGAKYPFYMNNRITLVPASGGETKMVAKDFDEDVDLVDWTAEGLYFAARQTTRAGLFLVDAKGVAKPVELPGTALAFRFSIAAGKVAFAGTGPNQFGEIYQADLAAPQPVKLTDAGAQLAAFATSRREVVQWKSKDGTQIEGVLFKPADFDANRKYPLLVVIHGGPTGVDTPAIGPDRYYPIEHFIAKGALVLKPNYRGSAGYGEKFRSLNVRNLGVGDYDDVISGVDSLIAKGFVDSRKVGSMGWSQGGYISAFITASSDRFAAVSVGAGISDWMTYYVNTDITPFTPQYLHATPWSDPEIYKKTSPISYIAHAQTPTLIQHGSVDKRVPIPNAYELRQALEDHNVPVKMVVYEGFGHSINKPKQQRAVMQENENWFAHYIWGEPLDPALTPVVKH